MESGVNSDPNENGKEQRGELAEIRAPGRGTSSSPHMLQNTPVAEIGRILILGLSCKHGHMMEHVFVKTVRSMW